MRGAQMMLKIQELISQVMVMKVAVEVMVMILVKMKV